MRNVIGLDIGLRNIKLINLTLKGRDIELLKFDIVELPKTSGQYEIINLLKFLFKNNQLKPSIPICLSISTEQSFFKIISVKSKGIKKLKEVIKDELRKNVVFSLEDCIWDYSVIKYNTKEMVNDVLLVAAKKEAVFEKVNLIEQFNGFIHLINLDILAIYNCLKFNAEISSGKLYALVDISSTKTQVLIFDDKRNFWMRSLSFGGDRFTEAIAKKLGLSLKEAQEHKEGMLLQKEMATKPDDISIPVMKEITAELDKTFNYYYFQASESATKGVEHKIDEILLTGGGSLYFGLDKFLSESLNIPTRYPNYLNKILIRDKRSLAKKNVLVAQSPQFATAIGLALEGLNFADIKINLIKKTKKGILQRIKLRYIYNIFIMLGIGLLVFLLTQKIALKKESKEIISKLNELNTISKEYIPKLTTLKETYEGTNSLIYALNTILNNRNIISRILYKISEVILEDVWITNFVVNLDYKDNAGELTLSGKSISYAGINKLISMLKDSGYFKVIKPVSSKIKIDEITKEEIVNFIIKLEIRFKGA